LSEFPRDLGRLPRNSEIPEELRKLERNYRDGIDPEVTAAVPAQQFRGIPWNSFGGREFRPTVPPNNAYRLSNTGVPGK